MAETKPLSPWPAVAGWLIALGLGVVLFRLVLALIQDFWLIAIAWMQP